MSTVCLAILGLGVSTATGWLLVTTLDRRVASPAAVMLQLSFAIVLGSFIHAIAYLVWALLLRAAPATFWIVDLLPLAAAAIVWARWRPEAEPAPALKATPPARLDPIACAAFVAFGLALLMAAAGAVQQASTRPQGLWDAWMMWNYRARMLFLAPPHLTDLYGPPFMHADYPMGLPLTIARLWRYAGAEPTWVPQGVGVACTLLPGLMLAAGVSLLRGGRVGAIAGVLLFGSLLFIRQGASQYADHPLTLAILAAALAAVLWLHEAPRRSPRLLVLVGVLAGAAAWTKNEGVAFAVLLSLLLLPWLVAAERPRVWRAAGALGLGLVAGVAMVLLHRAMAHEPTDLLQSFDPTMLWERAADLERYRLIYNGSRAAADAVGDTLAVLGVAAAALLTFGRRPAGTVASLCVVGGLFTGQAAIYLAIYLLLSTDLNWHLLTSADRLTIHLWPLLILFLALCFPRWPQCEREMHTALSKSEA